MTVHCPAAALSDRRAAGGAFEPIDDESCELRTSGDDLDWLAMKIAMVGHDFEVHEPPELVEPSWRCGSALGRLRLEPATNVKGGFGSEVGPEPQRDHDAGVYFHRRGVEATLIATRDRVFVSATHRRVSATLRRARGGSDHLLHPTAGDAATPRDNGSGNGCAATPAGGSRFPSAQARRGTGRAQPRPARESVARRPR